MVVTPQGCLMSLKASSHSRMGKDLSPMSLQTPRSPLNEIRNSAPLKVLRTDLFSLI
jgi:hypothetical protein